MRIDELILYRHFKHGGILENLVKLAKDPSRDGASELYYEAMHELIELAASQGYTGNLWHTYLTYLLANNENAYSMACEIKGGIKGSLHALAIHDFAIFKELFDLDPDALKPEHCDDCMSLIQNYVNEVTGSKLFNKRSSGISNNKSNYKCQNQIYSVHVSIITQPHMRKNMRATHQSARFRNYDLFRIFI